MMQEMRTAMLCRLQLVFRLRKRQPLLHFEHLFLLVATLAVQFVDAILQLMIRVRQLHDFFVEFRFSQCPILFNGRISTVKHG